MMRKRMFDSLRLLNDRRRYAVTLGIGLGLAGAVLGTSLALIGPVYTIVLLIALGAGAWVMAGLQNALWSILFIVLLLPYATLPLKVVLTPSFLDIAMLAVYGLYLFQWMTRERSKIATTPVHAFILLFMVVVLFSFVAGLRYAGLTSNRLRQFAELMMCIGIGLLAVDMVQTYSQLRNIVRALIVGGAIAAVIGITLWLLPDRMAENILSRLAVVGYPNSGVIHYIDDNPDLAERAIGTSVDPNSFGGVLVMVAVVTAAQLVTDKPVLGRKWMVAGLLLLMVICLGLTFSRGAMLAFAVAALFVGWHGDRRILAVMVIGAVLVLALPITQGYIERFVSGFQGTDLATQMRFGEYKDAIVLIQRYPLLGVGFTGTPDIDIYLGVASLYLTMASNMGLLGISAFASLVLAVASYAYRARKAIRRRSQLFAIWLGLVGALLTVIVSGIFDHYFFNLEFFHASAILWLTVGLLLTASSLALKQQMGSTAPEYSI